MRACTFSKTRSWQRLRAKLTQPFGQLFDAQAVEVDAERPMLQGAHLLQAQRADVDLPGRYAELPHQRAGVGRASAAWCRNPAWSAPGCAARGTARASNVLQATSSASVESSPPETPMATAGLPMCSSRRARPATWVLKISSQRSRNCSWPRGTNGWPSMNRRSGKRDGCVSSAKPIRSGRAGVAGVELRLAEAVGAEPIDAQPVEIDVGDEEVGLRAGSGATRPAGCRSRRSGSVRRRRRRWWIPTRRTSVDVGRHAAARLIDDELLAVGGLADDLVAGGQVDEHRGAGDGLVASWAEWAPTGPRRSPRRSSSPSTSSAANSRSVPKGTHGAEQGNLAAAGGGGGGEPAALVELLVVGEERLGHDAEQLAAVERRRRS